MILKTWKCGRADSTVQIVEIESTLNTSDSSERDFSVYPNPASEVINFTTPSGIENKAVYIRFIDISGRIILSQYLSTEKQTVDVSHFHSGIYLLQLLDDQVPIGTKRLIID